MPPDCCDYNGLTAPYPNSFGEMTMYKEVLGMKRMMILRNLSFVKTKKCLRKP